MKGGMFYNQPLNTIEVWHRTARWAWNDINTNDSFLRGKRVALDMTGLNYLQNSIDFSVNGTRFAHFVVGGASATEYGALALGYGNGTPLYFSRFKLYIQQHNCILFDGNSSGSAAAPIICLASDDSGFYAIADDEIGVSCAAQLRLVFNSAGLRVESGRILNQNGSNASPSYSFTGDIDTGMLSAGADQLGFATGGVRRLTIDNTRAYFANLISVGTDNDNFIGSDADGQMRFGTDNTERMRLVNQGLLINRTTNSTSNCRLDVEGDARCRNTCGEMVYTSIATTCSANNTWYKVDTSDGTVVGGISYSASTDNLNVTTRGRFRVDYSVSFYASSGFITRFAIFQGGAEVAKSKREMFHASVAGAGAPRSVAGSYLVDVSADTTFDLRVQCSDGASQTITINNGTLLVHRV
jgi:hypothetical protein